MIRKFAAEFLGTAILVFFSVGLRQLLYRGGEAALAHEAQQVAKGGSATAT